MCGTIYECDQTPAPGTVGSSISAYISGYADGEGCFTGSISPRGTLRTGWEVRPSFSVSQSGDRAEVLHVLQAYFGAEASGPIAAIGR